MPKIVELTSFWKPEACVKTVFPDRSLLMIEQCQNEKKSNAIFKVIFKHCENVAFELLNFWILAFFTNFPIKPDLSGIAVWPQASGFQKLVKIEYFGIFN